MKDLLTQKFPIAAIVMLLILGISCSHEPAVEEENQGNTVNNWQDSVINGNASMAQMSFRVGDSISVVSEGKTRATTTVAGVTTFALNDIITIGVGSTTPKDYKVSNVLTGALTYNGTETDAYFWANASQTVTLRAWSYGNTTTNSGDPDNATYTLPTDQSSDYGELLYAPSSNFDYATYQSGIPVTLYHQLARLVINLTHVKDGDLDVSEIYIGDGSSAVIPTTAKFHKPTSGNIGTWDDIGTETGQIVPKTETANACYSAVLIPTTYAADQKFLTIKTTDNRTYCYIPETTITLTGGNQYTYTISVKDLKEVSTLTIGDISTCYYTGSAIEPHPTITDGTKTLTENTDYTLSWTNNINAGTATITVTGIGGYYSGTQSKTFTINPKPLTSAEFYFASSTVTRSYIWEIATGTNALTKPNDCNVTFSSSVSSVATIDANTGALTPGGTLNTNSTITATASGNYTGTATYTIKATSSKKTYSCTESLQSELLCSGKYKLEVYGAAGSSGGDATAGKGGYSYGNIQLSSNSTLYICVGRAGYEYGWDNQYVGKTAAYFDSKRPYNGGGYGHGFGGGATHIASTLRGTGVLVDYKNYQNEVIIVAGGGGGGESCGVGGSGGGTNGGNGTGTCEASSSSNGKGGSQTQGGAGGVAYGGHAAGSAGSFGLGGHSIQLNVYEKGSGGGGGWYGGGGSFAYNLCGGGGSGHIGSSILTSSGNTSGMSNGVQSGSGQAIITWLSN